MKFKTFELLNLIIAFVCSLLGTQATFMYKSARREIILSLPAKSVEQAALIGAIGGFALEEVKRKKKIPQGTALRDD